MHNGSVYSAVAMRVRVMKDASDERPGYREDEVTLIMEDGSIWQMERLLVPVGANPVGFRTAAGNLKRQRQSQAGRAGAWRMVRGAVAGVTLAGQGTV